MSDLLEAGGKPTHDGLAASLAAHLRASTDRMVWTDMQLGPAGSPRPDVYAIRKSYTRFESDAYEVKVSVSDLKADTSSGKWQTYRPYAHRVWFAFPKGLVPADDVPRECGVIVWSVETGTWKALRRPISRPLDTLPQGAWMKLLMDGVDRARVPDPRERRGDAWWVAQQARKKAGETIASLMSGGVEAQEIFKASIEKLRKATEENRAREREMVDEARKRAEREAQRLTLVQQQLAATLGLPATASVPELTERIARLSRDFNPRRDIDYAIEALGKAREAYAGLAQGAVALPKRKKPPKAAAASEEAA